MDELESKTVKELQDKLVELGMSAEDAQAFKTKAPLIASIKTIMAKNMVAPQTKEEVKRVATLEEAPNPQAEREVNKRWLSKAEKMRDHLATQRKVRILIPLEAGEKPGVVEVRMGKNGVPYQFHVSGAVENVTLNGFKTIIPKGVYFEVPEQVADVVSRSQNVTTYAGSKISIDRIDPNTGRPMSEIL